MMKNEDFQNVYSEYREFSVRVASKFVKDENLAEDISHEVFYHLYMVKDSIDISNVAKLRSLIFTATVNKVRDYFRRSAVKNESCTLDDDNGVEPEDSRYDPERMVLRMEEKEYRKLVLQKLHRERPVDYDILIKVKYLGMSPDSVAAEYGVSRNNVNNHIWRTKIWLEHEMAKIYGDQKTRRPVTKTSRIPR